MSPPPRPSPLQALVDWLTEEVPQEGGGPEKRPPRPAARRRSAPGRPSRRRGGRPLLAVLAGAVALGVAVAFALHHGPAPRAGAAPGTRPAASTAAASSPAPAVSSPRAVSSTGGAAPAASPDCAAMHMTALPPAPGAAAPPVAGLCFNLGNGENWLVGCARGFQATCDPALQPVIACLRQAGAASRAGVSETDVERCAASVAAALTRGAAG